MSNLFDIQISHADKEYIALRDKRENCLLKKYCEDAWVKFRNYADQLFREEFARQPRRRFWEMYLGVYLLDNNFNLAPHIPYGPDLHLIQDDQNIWIEATVPGEGAGDDAVPSPYIPDANRLVEIPEDKIILRYTNAVSEKVKKYDTYLRNGIIDSKDAFVIAINGMDIGFEILNASPIPAIVKALYPIKDIQLHFNTETFELIDQELIYRDKVSKRSQMPVSTKIFLDPQYSGISGVLYSDARLWDPPQDSGNEFLFIHNFLAKNNNLKKTWIKKGRYCWLENNKFRFETIFPTNM